MERLVEDGDAISPDRLVAVAARNNAEWCEVICRLSGTAGEFWGDAWTVGARPPEHYPDAVTLTPGVDVARLLSRIDDSSGCSVKDSYAELDLRPWGFGRLFEAYWIHRPADIAPDDRPALDLDPVRDQATLAVWERAWGAGATESGVFRPDLLARDDVVVLAARDADSIVAGAILSLGAGAVGISNLFTAGTGLTAAFTGAAAVAARLFPQLPMVGYESGPFLEAAEQAGFRAVGPLAVWLRS